MKKGKGPGRGLGLAMWSAGTVLALLLAAGVLGTWIKGLDPDVCREALTGAGKQMVRYLAAQACPAAFERSRDWQEEIYLDPDPAYRRSESLRRLQGSRQQNQESMIQEEPGIAEPEEAVTLTGDRPVIGTTYVMEQLADYDFLMKNFYNVHTSAAAPREILSAQDLLGEDLSLDRSEAEGPQILIYHTHSQEAFQDSGPGETVVGVGARLALLLEQKGYQVYHDTSVYDLDHGKLDRSKAYTYACEGIERILQEHPSIQVILDIHRDGVAQDLHLAAEVDGKPVAQIMFFNGMSRTPEGQVDYLPNPYIKENLAFSLQMQLKAQAYFPGFTRKIYLKGLRYNLHLRPRSSLIEVGAQTNTYQEALNAMEPLSELLDMVLQGK